MKSWVVRSTLVVLVGTAMSANAAETEMSIQARHDQLLTQLKDVITVDPLIVYSSYSTNEYAAASKYKGAWYNIEGFVSRVRPDNTGIPVIDIVSAKGMYESVTLKLFSAQIASHNASGYNTITRQQLVETLPGNVKIIANCRMAGKLSRSIVMDNCLVYTSDDYSKLYKAK